MDLLLNNTSPRRKLVLYFQVHQPKRLSKLRFFDIGAGNSSFDEQMDRDIVRRVARECYLPTNALLKKIIKKFPDVRVAFSLSGVLMDQLEENAPEVLESFRQLAFTGAVEFLAETHYHSLACMMPGKELELQILKHAEKIDEHFGVHPSVFRNTELIYSDDIGRRISKLGFSGVMADGVEKILHGQTSNHVFEHPDQRHLKILLRNYRLSDDIAFRFSSEEKALSAEKYLSWLDKLPASDEVVTLAMDYETFGEHQRKETGIFKFLEEFLTGIAKSKTYEMLLPSEAIEQLMPNSVLHVPNFISWADQERDLSAWLGNEMQRDAFDSLLKLEVDVKNIDDENLLHHWRNLQTSDHFYYMSTKKGGDGVVHNYFSPYPSPYEAFINYMNVLTDFSMRVQVLNAGKIDPVRVNENSGQPVANRMTMLATR